MNIQLLREKQQTDLETYDISLKYIAVNFPKWNTQQLVAHASQASMSICVYTNKFFTKHV